MGLPWQFFQGDTAMKWETKHAIKTFVGHAIINAVGFAAMAYCFAKMMGW